MPRKQFDDEFLRRLRNEIPIDRLIKHLGWPNKRREGQFVFLCPRCQESLSDIKRETNLGRCFHCETNYNPIDFTMEAREYDFVQAVQYLTPFLPS
ncbi:MAG TPA: hypothetical protein EYM33_05035 [Pseudomonadales bacterium]|nr:hypothetical protein [Pseudomonadales bacterium]